VYTGQFYFYLVPYLIYEFVEVTRDWTCTLEGRGKNIQNFGVKTSWNMVSWKIEEEMGG
jgi:hypothetical protein